MVNVAKFLDLSVKRRKITLKVFIFSVFYTYFILIMLGFAKVVGKWHGYWGGPRVFPNFGYSFATTAAKFEGRFC